MSTFRPSRPASAWGAALGLAAIALVVPPSIASAAADQPGTIAVSVASKGPATVSLRKAKVTVSAVRPASASRTRWTMPVSGAPSLDATSFDLAGRLKFARGKRSVSFASLRLSLGKKPVISGVVGKKRVTILTLSGAPKRDAGARTVNLKNATTSLSPAAVRTLRSGLSSSQVKAGRLGKTTVAVRVPAAPAAPAPQPNVPAPPLPVDPGGLLPELPAPPPAPEPVCWAPTPPGVTDWIGCGTQTGGNLRGWTSYIRGGGSITLIGDALVTPSGTGFDHRFSVASTGVDPVSKTVTITHTGGIAFYKSYGPAGYLDVRVENLRFVVSADRATADVFLDATYNVFGDPAPAEPHPNVNAMTVDLTAARSALRVGSGITYERAPAKLTAEGRTIWDDRYEAGAAFGAFTITVPDAG